MKLPLNERPRERLLTHGSHTLALHELIAILLETGTTHHDVISLSHTLIASYPSVHDLMAATIEELTALPGIGPAKAIRLQAAFALARHLEKPPKPPETLDELFHTIKHEFGVKEALMVLLLNTKEKIFYREIIARGTLTEVLIHPREVFHLAVKKNAHSIMLAHNHPSGDPTPSVADLQLTEHLLEAGKVMGIPLKDHLILGRDSYTSLFKRPLQTHHHQNPPQEQPVKQELCQSLQVES